MSRDEDRQFHDLMSFVGIRAPLTAVALLQLVRELRKAGVLDEAAIDRIKASIVREAQLNRRPHLSKEDSEAGLRSHLDRLFADEEKP